MNKNLLPADELAIIRAEIKDLRHREAQLRAVFLENDSGETQLGSWHDVEIVTHQSRVFDPAALPDHIRNDPKHWRMLETRTVRICEPQMPKPPSAKIFNLRDHQNMK